jgi:fumarate hydratase subunit alpha
VSTVREIDVSVLRQAVARLLADANHRIPPDILAGLRRAVIEEASPIGRQTLEQLVRNYEVAAEQRIPACQDSGITVVYLEQGQDVHWVGGDLQAAIDEGVRDGTRDGFLRWSVTGDALRRTTDEPCSPASVHVDIVPGEAVTLTVASKGFGAENQSRLRMLMPADGVEGVRRFVLETVDRAGANACPPVIVGVGVGGTFDKAAWLAKKAVLRRIDQRHPRAHVRRMEEELLGEINRLGIGPQGFGGLVTALAVNIEVGPTHIAGLPVAVNLGCHSTRRQTIVI